MNRETGLSTIRLALLTVCSSLISCGDEHGPGMRPGEPVPTMEEACESCALSFDDDVARCERIFAACTGDGGVGMTVQQVAACFNSDVSCVAASFRDGGACLREAPCEDRQRARVAECGARCIESERGCFQSSFVELSACLGRCRQQTCRNTCFAANLSTRESCGAKISLCIDSCQSQH